MQLRNKQTFLFIPVVSNFGLVTNRLLSILIFVTAVQRLYQAQSGVLQMCPINWSFLFMSVTLSCVVYSYSCRRQSKAMSRLFFYSSLKLLTADGDNISTPSEFSSVFVFKGRDDDLRSARRCSWLHAECRRISPVLTTACAVKRRRIGERAAERRATIVIQHCCRESTKHRPVLATPGTVWSATTSRSCTTSRRRQRWRPTPGVAGSRARRCRSTRRPSSVRRPPSTSVERWRCSAQTDCTSLQRRRSPVHCAYIPDRRHGPARRCTSSGGRWHGVTMTLTARCTPRSRRSTWRGGRKRSSASCPCILRDCVVLINWCWLTTASISNMTTMHRRLNDVKRLGLDTRCLHPLVSQSLLFKSLQ